VITAVINRVSHSLIKAGAGYRVSGFGVSAQSNGVVNANNNGCKTDR